MTRTMTTMMILLTGAVLTTSASAEIQEYFSMDEWSGEAGEFTTIDFTGFEDGTFITDQLEDQGVVFTDDDNFINTGVFPDGAGLFDQETGLPEPDDMWLEFSQPMTSIAVDFPGGMQIELFDDGNPIAKSSFVDPFTDFFGITSQASFDTARLLDPAGGTAIDNLHFGPPVPAPGALGLLGIAALMRCRRRRCA